MINELGSLIESYEKHINLMHDLLNQSIDQTQKVLEQRNKYVEEYHQLYEQFSKLVDDYKIKCNIIQKLGAGYHEKIYGLVDDETKEFIDNLLAECRDMNTQHNQ